jgi:hypothetical protein
VPIVLGCAAVAIATAALLVALTRSSTTRTATPPTTTTTVGTCATSATQAADFVSQVHQQGRTALQSQPVNVIRNGMYVFVFGPLTPRDNARFNEAQRSSGFAFPIRGDEFSPQVQRDRMTKVVGTSDALFVDVPVTVTDFKAPCAGLRAWLQY